MRELKKYIDSLKANLSNISNDENLAFLNCIKHYELIYEAISSRLPVNNELKLEKSAKSIAIDTYDYLRKNYYLNEAEELVKLMSSVHFKSFLICLEKIANKDFLPRLNNVPYEVDEEDVNMKICTLIKHDEPLGATIKVSERTGSISIARIMHGGAADRSGSIQAGDEIREINGISVRNRDPMDIIRLLATSHGPVRLKLIPQLSLNSSSGDTPPVNLASGNIGIHSHLRALTNYNPEIDTLIPCREAGIRFEFGDVLQLVNTEDQYWWQAIKVDSASCNNQSEFSGSYRTGLIPSRLMWDKKSRLSSLQTSESSSSSKKSQINPYEEVDQFFAGDQSTYRPIVLIGPRGVGKSELARGLISTDSRHFRDPIRISTRKMSASDIVDRNFLEVNDDEFNTFLVSETLIDQTEEQNPNGQKPIKSGLCVDSVLDVTQAGNVAVFTVQANNLLNLIKNSGLLKPFIVFVKPPSLDVLIETRSCNTQQQNQHHPSQWTTSSLASSQIDAVNHHRLQQMIYESQQILSICRSIINFQLVNDDLPVALEKLSAIAYKLETEAFWIPKRWLTGINNLNQSDSSMAAEIKENLH